MEISQERLKEIIKKVLLEQYPDLPEKKKALTRKPLSAYVLCETGHEAVFLSFLRDNKAAANAFSVTAVLESLDEELIRTLLSEKLCEKMARPDAVSCLDSDSISIYPTFSRNSMCEIALGMDAHFSSVFMRKDFEAGRKSVVLLSGLDPFTGKEPLVYRDKVISYIREMLKMGVRFVKGGSDMGTALNTESTPAVEVRDSGIEEAAAGRMKTQKPEEVYRLKTQGNLVTASDIRKIPAGSTVYFAEQKILTPLAKDAVQDLNLKLIRG